MHESVKEGEINPINKSDKAKLKRRIDERIEYDVTRYSVVMMAYEQVQECTVQIIDVKSSFK